MYMYICRTSGHPLRPHNDYLQQIYICMSRRGMSASGEVRSLVVILRYRATCGWCA